MSGRSSDSSLFQSLPGDSNTSGIVLERFIPVVAFGGFYGQEHTAAVAVAGSHGIPFSLLEPLSAFGEPWHIFYKNTIFLRDIC